MKNIIKKIFNHKSHKPAEPAIMTLCVQERADSEVCRMVVDDGFLNWFVVNGKDLEVYKCWVE